MYKKRFKILSKETLIERYFRFRKCQRSTGSCLSILPVRKDEIKITIRKTLAFIFGLRLLSMKGREWTGNEPC